MNIERLKTDAAYWDENLDRHPLEIPYGWGTDRCIPRPAKEIETEWDGKGLPPIGCECEVKNTRGEWRECLIVGYNKACTVFYCDSWTVGSDYDAFPASEFRPIRTKEQRFRDELVVEIWGSSGVPKGMAANIVDAILAKYNLTEK